MVLRHRNLEVLVESPRIIRLACKYVTTDSVWEEHDNNPARAKQVRDLLAALIQLTESPCVLAAILGCELGIG
jgi:hypothetical protein